VVQLNDVPVGGATVFPKLKVTLWPERGAAAVWFNLHRDGVGDVRTQHAGCPVLVGTKWGT
jgi:prolyl 4-hydroxylase